MPTSRIRRTARGLLPAALCVMLAGCDETVQPDLSVEGELRFDYSGAISGSYSARGQLPLDASGIPTSMPSSGATAVVSEHGLTLLAAQGTGVQQGNVLMLHLGGFTGPGTYQMASTACNAEAPSNCRLGVFMPAASLDDLKAAARLGTTSTTTYFIAVGTVTVTRYASGRVRGTFSVSGATPPSQGFASVTLANGQFELPVQVGP